LRLPRLTEWIQVILSSGGVAANKTFREHVGGRKRAGQGAKKAALSPCAFVHR